MSVSNGKPSNQRDNKRGNSLEDLRLLVKGAGLANTTTTTARIPPNCLVTPGETQVFYDHFLKLTISYLALVYTFFPSAIIPPFHLH